MNPWKLLQAIKNWPVASQQAARRNALVASTALTQLRIERDEIEAFVEAAAARHEVRANRTAALA
ncbi:MAG TPA: hypothetical protein VLI04_22000 [Nocardioidaceae bacterium]|nr:hypothetical protein [Nocardioidaceae bacterium]